MTPRRITIVTAQLLGHDRTGGVGTAMTFLALGLRRIGHHVDVLYLGDANANAMDADWARRYEESGTSVRVLSQTDAAVEPAYFARLRAVEVALRADPGDVVITHEFGAPAYTAMRLRRLGLAFETTSFVVFCHGTRRWVKEMNRNERVSADVLAVSRLEQKAVELADVAVSPSAYLVDWMRQQGWRLPEATHVIPLLTRSSSTGEAPPAPSPGNGDRPVDRLAFFGRLEERKGVQPFAAGLNAMPAELLEGVELEFIGKPTKYWSPEQVEGLLSRATKRALRSVSFETGLDQHEALARLGRPGTLAVMPSLAENSPNVVYECLERRIPFLASATGGIGELVAREDHERVLFEPTAEGVAAALSRALTARDALRPARPGFDAAASLDRWAEVAAAAPREVVDPPASDVDVEVIVAERSSATALARCLAALEAQTYGQLRVIVRPQDGSAATARAAALQGAAAPWVVFLDEEDLPEPDFVETLVRAQVASGADVVSCGLSFESGDGSRAERFFSGEPGGVGLLTNDYGTVGLFRRTLLDDLATPWPVAGDPDWPLLARLSASGAQIVSVPIPLVTRVARPGTLEHVPSDGLLVVEHLEHALPPHLRSLARLAAGLAAEVQRQSQAG